MNAICTIADCNAPHVARQLCRKHYMRWKRHGSPEPGNTRAHSVEQVKAKIRARTVKRCINPDHLEAVTQQANNWRKPEEVRRRPTCKRGHPWTSENTIMEAGGIRRCRTCREQYLVEWRSRHVA